LFTVLLSLFVQQNKISSSSSSSQVKPRPRIERPRSNFWPPRQGLTSLSINSSVF